MTHEAIKIRKLDTLWFSLIVFAGAVLSATLASTLFEMSVSLSGILCVGLIAIGRREGFLIGIYNSLSYSMLAYSNGLFGEMYLNLLFFVPTGVIGYLMWGRHTLKNKTVAMRQLSRTYRWYVATACILSTSGLGLLLQLNPDQNTPFIDATTNVLSIVATFLMMWRYKEQWLLYILLNIITIIMWALRVLAEGEAGDLMVLMWSIFLLNSVFGYWRWHNGSNSAVTFNTPNTEDATCDAA